MKLHLLCLACLLASLAGAAPATLYVSAASTKALPPYTNWATAAAVIQDAVDAAAPGDEIVVANGVYQTGATAVYGMSNRVAVTKPVTLRSVNGPAVTSIVGSGPSGPAAVRCVYLTNGAVLAGFALTTGATQTSGDAITNRSGGGVWCEGLSAVVSNCVLTGNSAGSYGGGAFSGTLNNCTLTGNSGGWYGGGAGGGTLNSCTLTGNSADYGGGAEQSTLNNCTLTGNTAWSGGGVYSSTLKNCTLSANGGSDGGGAAWSTLNNCRVTGNRGGGDGGGGSGGAVDCVLINCTITGNRGENGGGVASSTLTNCTLTGNLATSGYTDYVVGGGAAWSTLENCTVTGNSVQGDIPQGGGVYSCSLNNCIVYYNSDNCYYVISFNHCCTTPDPGSGVGNITNEPAFVDAANGSFRLQPNSPCINTGNNAYAAAATDLDGLPRVVNGTVDMGAYEWQVPVEYAPLAPPGAGGMALSFTGEINRVYGLYGSSNLLDWFWLAGLTTLPGVAAYPAPLPPPPPRRFYKAVPVP
jgi:hypothetical protein